MSIYINYWMTCNVCTKQLEDERRGHHNDFVHAENEEELLIYADKLGWTREQVPNGSNWDFCPKCYKAYLRGEIE